jgi:hypothetical protein
VLVDEVHAAVDSNANSIPFADKMSGKAGCRAALSLIKPGATNQELGACMVMYLLWSTANYKDAASQLKDKEALQDIALIKLDKMIAVYESLLKDYATQIAQVDSVETLKALWRTNRMSLNQHPPSYASPTGDTGEWAYFAPPKSKAYKHEEQMDAELAQLFHDLCTS